MALTRAFLKGMNLTDEQVDAIIGEHTGVTSGLKDTIADLKGQIDGLQEKADKYDATQKELNDLKKDIKDNDWQNKYNKEHEDFEKYKTEVTDRETKAKVTEAYRKLLGECKVGSKHVDSIIRVTDFKDMKLKEDGTLDNADVLKKSIETDWSGFITSEGTKGADVDTPPAGGGDNGGKGGRAAEIAAEYHKEMYGEGKEN